MLRCESLLVVVGILTAATLAAADNSSCPDQDMYRNIAIVCAACAAVLFVVVLIMTAFMKRILDHQRLSRQLMVDRNNLRMTGALSSNSDIMNSSRAPSVATTSVTMSKSLISHSRGAPSEQSVAANLGRALSGYDQSIDAMLGVPIGSPRAPVAPAGREDFVGTALGSAELKQQRAARRANIRRKSSMNSEDIDDDDDDQLAVSRGVNIVSQEPYMQRTGSARRMRLDGPGAREAYSDDPLHRGNSASQTSLDFEWPDVDSDSDAGGDEVDLSARRDARNKKAGSASEYGYQDFLPLAAGAVPAASGDAPAFHASFPPVGGSVQSLPGAVQDEGDALAAFDAAINALDEDHDAVEQI